MKTLKTTQDYVNIIDSGTTIAAVLFTQADGKCARCNQAIHTLKNLESKISVHQMPVVMDMYPVNQLGIKTVPTLVIFKAGKEVLTLAGTSPELYKKEYQSVLHNNY